MLKYLLHTGGFEFSNFSLGPRNSLIIFFATSWVAAAFHPERYSSFSFQNTATPKDSSLCLWMWQIHWNVLERLWKSPDIITDQSDTAESCFHYLLHRHKVKILALFPLVITYMGMPPADLPVIGASSPPPDFHAHLLLPCTFFPPSGSHHLSLYSNQGTVTSAFMLPVKLPYSLCKGDTKIILVNVLTLYTYDLTIFYASMVLQSCLIFMSRWVDSYWVN